MPDISTIKLPNDNNTYYIKDSTARIAVANKADLNHTHTTSDITDYVATTDTWRGMNVNGNTWKGTGTSTGVANFKAGTNVTLSQSGNDLTISATLPSGGIQFMGVAANEATIKAKTNVAKGELWIATDTSEEWLCTTAIGSTASAAAWEKLGGTYGDLAYADTASASYTPAGSVVAGTGTAAPGTATVNSITAVGSLPSFTRGTFSAGTLPSLTTSVADEVLTIGWSAGTLPSHAADTFSAGTLPTKGSNQTVLTSIGTPKFTGTAATITVTPD